MKLGFKTKFFLLMMIPVVGVMYFAGSSVNVSYSIKSNAALTIQMSNLSTYLGALVHELQKERGMTAGFLGSSGIQFRDQLPGQRGLTDEKLSALLQYIKANSGTFHGELMEHVDLALDRIKMLPDIREKVTRMSINGKEAIDGYTSVNTLILEAVSHLSHGSLNADITRNLDAYSALLLSKERAGIERAVLTNVFAADSFTGREGMYHTLIELISMQNTYAKLFTDTADQELVTYYNHQTSQEPFRVTATMREKALTGYTASSLGVNAQTWFDAQTQKINLLKDVESRVSTHLVALADDIYNSANLRFMMEGAGALTLSVVTLVIF